MYIENVHENRKSHAFFNPKLEFRRRFRCYNRQKPPIGWADQLIFSAGDVAIGIAKKSDDPDRDRREQPAPGTGNQHQKDIEEKGDRDERIALAMNPHGRGLL